ncbi:hypothetical protein LOD99_9796 [Oopsacas minuta]|uniref:Uncharacterized protein n=1 Tax=Oopsacas minuta TaxID=111878 RepID=A0AAV7KKV7_9METZ|nr:hypothetical protein LOD99_9796 [Oopsacas minuta]
MCGQIASYYRLAVQRNKGDVQAIIRAIKAIPLHLEANNKNAVNNHQYYLSIQNSWCQYQAAIVDKKPPPHHPNYLSHDAVNIIDVTSRSFKLDTPSFIHKISGGRTSNNNEAIHSILFSMVKKTDSVGLDVLRIGSALAVIIFNDGYHGIQKVFKTLEIVSGPHLSDRLQELDNKRIKHSHYILRNQQRKFARKQRRGKKVRVQIRKHGEGYHSGKYTSGRKDTDSVSDSEEVVPLPISSRAQNTSESEIESGENTDDCMCELCGHTYKDGTIGIGLGAPIPKGKIK